MDYKRNQKYFQSYETLNLVGGILGCVIGGLMLFSGILTLIYEPGAGVVNTLFALAILAAGIRCLIEKKRAITDEAYDAATMSMLKNVKRRALNKLGLDEDEVKEIAPISFDGYVYKGASRVKLGKDGLWRTNKYESVTLFFSENEVHCYTYTFDTLTPKQTEATDVYFYKDIVSVSTASDSVRVLTKMVDYEYFKLTTAGGTALSVSLRDTGGAQRSINAMRALLKTKKQES